MATPISDNKVDIKYIMIAGIAVIFSWILHEWAHWLAGTFLGYDMAMTLNTTYPLAGEYASDLHYQVISAAGPALTLLEAVIVFMIMRRKAMKWLYPFLFTCFYMRLLAAVISLRNPNDEARISKALGAGTFSLPVIVTIVLFLLVYKTSRHYGFSQRFNFINTGLVLFFSSVIILGDQYTHIRLL